MKRSFLRCFWVSLIKLGDLAVAQGNLVEAQLLFTDSLRIIQPLADSDPGNTAWQRDLAQSHCWIGVVLQQQGNLESAKKSFSRYRDTMQHLAESDLGNAAWQRDLSVSVEKLGDLAVAQGNLPEAQRLFTDSLRIIQRLADSDSSNAAWQRDLYVSHWRVANLLEKQGDTKANDHWREAHDTLAAMVQAGLFVSSADRQLLERLRAKIGG